MLIRLVIAGIAGGISGALTLAFGGSYHLALVCAFIAGILSAVFRDLFLLIIGED